MKAIETRYHAWTNHKPTRISARTNDVPAIFLSRDGLPEDDHDAHESAALALIHKMGWRNRNGIIGGSTKAGMAWVFVPESK